MSVDLGAIHGLIAMAESAVEDETKYTLPDGTPTYDDVRSVRMIVRDKSLAKCAGMLGLLLEVYEVACAQVDSEGMLLARKRKHDDLCVAVDRSRGFTTEEAISARFAELNGADGEAQR